MNIRHLFFLVIIISCFIACQEQDETSSITYQFPKTVHMTSKVEGFEVQTVQQGQGEWLSVAKDPQGRLLISPRKGNLLRFTIPTDSTQNLTIDTLDVGVNDCQGLLYAYGHLYMMGSGKDNIRGVYRLKDLDGQGQFDVPILMREFPKNGDHSGHTLALGPDGAIYFLSGNDNRPPKGEDVSYVYENWQNDHLMPLSSIFGTEQKPPGGYVLKTDSVGSHWQLISYGLRNPYDMCFSAEGELFTFDSDMEWDFNLPWYIPTRVNHLVSGGDYAWRQSTAKRFDYYPDILPSVVEFGRGSPTATCFGTGTRFPAKYQKALFLGDWSYGKIYAMFLEPDGATYKATYEPMVTGQPLNITDMIVGEDGTLYFLTGGNGTDTGLYRIVYKGKEKTTPVKKEEKLHSNLLLRRKLEAYHFAKDTSGLALAMQHIAHPDRFVRYAAKTILERNHPDLWLSRLNGKNNPDTQISLLTAIIRSDTTDKYQTLTFEQLNKLGFASLSEVQQLGVLRLYALAFLRSKTLPKDKAGSIYQALLPFYPSKNTALNKELSRVLGYLAHLKGDGKEMIATTFDLIESTPDPVQFIHYLEVIRLIPKGWTLQQRGAYKHWMQYARANLTGGSLFNYFLNEIEKEFNTTLSDEEIKWLAENSLEPLKKGYDGPVKPKPKVAQSAFEESKVYTQWKMEDLQYGLEMVTSPRNELLRDFNRGQRMFAKGQCYNCHYMINKGGGYGPELTLAGNSFSAEDLLMAILEPSKDINSRFQSTIFEMKDGSSIAGRLMTGDNYRYVVQASYEPESAQEVLKSQVKSQKEAEYSDMPAGLINPMSSEEIMDLLYFIVQVAKKNDEALELAIFEEKPIFEMGDSSLIEMIQFGKTGKIYYTLDGSEPSSKSILYESPFFVNKSTLIKASVIDGDQVGKVAIRQVHGVDKAENGLDWKLYRNIIERFKLPSNKKPDASGVAYTFDVRPIAESENNFEVHFEGFLQIDVAGEYNFYTKQDDAMRMYLDDKLVIDASRANWQNDAKTSIKLGTGKHRIRVEFYDNLSLEYLDIQYEHSKIPRQAIPGNKLFRASKMAL